MFAPSRGASITTTVRRVSDFPADAAILIGRGRGCQAGAIPARPTIRPPAPCDNWVGPVHRWAEASAGKSGTAHSRVGQPTSGPSHEAVGRVIHQRIDRQHVGYRVGRQAGHDRARQMASSCVTIQATSGRVRMTSTFYRRKTFAQFGVSRFIAPDRRRTYVGSSVGSSVGLSSDQRRAVDVEKTKAP
jgi:hypothetical protein